MICFQLRVIVSAKSSSRSLGCASRSAVSTAACSSGMIRICSGRNAVARAARRQQLRHLVGLPAARLVVAPEDVAVELAGRDPADVARCPRRAGRPARPAPPCAGPPASSRSTRSAHRRDRGRVVAVVEDDLERVLVEDVHPARGLEERGVEGAQPVADVLELEPMLKAIAAANIAFCTLCSARPSSVAGIRWVHSSGMWAP